MPPNPELRSQERRRPPRTRETAEQRAIRIRLSSGRDNGATGRDNGASGRDNGAKSPGARLGCDLDSLVKGQRFTTAARTISAADVGSLSPAGDEASGTRSGGVAPAALVISYALGLVPLVDERIVSVRRRGDVALEQPARVGDRLHVEGTIDAVEAMDDETGLVHMTWNVVTQTRQPVARMEVDALWHRGSELGSSCQEQDCVKRESAAALPS